jgi:hypothetical protein
MREHRVAVTFYDSVRKRMVNLSLSIWGAPSQDQIHGAFLRYYYRQRGGAYPVPPYRIKEVVPCCG